MCEAIHGAVLGFMLGFCLLGAVLHGEEMRDSDKLATALALFVMLLSVIYTISCAVMWYISLF